jgi:hypothetical protein
MSCNITKHEFFVGKSTNTGASFDNEDNALLAYASLYRDAKNIAAGMVDGRTINYESPTHTFKIQCNPINKIVFANMDGKTSLKRLIKKIKKSVGGIKTTEIKKEILNTYNNLNPIGFLFLVAAGHQGKKLPDYGELVSLHSANHTGELPEVLRNKN